MKNTNVIWAAYSYENSFNRGIFNNTEYLETTIDCGLLGNKLNAACLAWRLPCEMIRTLPITSLSQISLPIPHYKQLSMKAIFKLNKWNKYKVGGLLCQHCAPGYPKACTKVGKLLVPYPPFHSSSLLASLSLWNTAQT